MTDDATAARMPDLDRPLLLSQRGEREPFE